VSAWKTRSGAPDISISAITAFSVVMARPEQPVMPEPMIDRTERLGIQAVQALAPETVFADEPGTAEQAQVFGDGRAGGRKAAGDLAGGLLPMAKEIENRATGGVGQGPKDRARRMSNGTVSHDV
jgi:hypothetical protein